VASNSIEAQTAAVAAGLGAAMLPAFLADARRDFVRLVPAAHCVTLDLWLVFHRDLRDQPRLRAVAEHVTATAHAWRKRLEG
jgi:DNA-binding transcriptional LysR family regulator